MTRGGAWFAALAGVAFAAAPPAVAASSRADASGSHATSTFVLAVGNNQSLRGGRPDLRYADDDALKYAALFEAALPSPHIELLTRPDVESQRLHPGARVTGRPSRAGLKAASDRLRAAVADARARGHDSQLFVTFASHGDQRKGKGYLELEDGELTGEHLAAVIDRIGADTTHLILDSCNSYFVIHPRRPGGRVWSSDAQPAASPLQDREDVGVFLSTSAEAQVFEWSHLQSGVFSHAVRSGLAGAADQDGDRRITYGELNAWVRTATRDLENSLYQPHLYVRAPDARVMLDLREAPGRSVILDGFTERVTLRDGRGVRLLDVRPEPGFSPRLVVPVADDVSVLAPVAGPLGRRTLRTAMLTGTRVTPRDLVDDADTARGPVRLLEQLFSSPWGPDAFDEERARIQKAPPMVYGLDRELEKYLELQLETMARQSLYERVAIGAAALAIVGGGAAYLAAATVLTLTGQAPIVGLLFPLILASVTSFLPGVALALYAVWPSKEERIYAEYQDAPSVTDQERAARVAVAVDDIVSYSDRSAWIRWITAGFVALLGAPAIVLPLVLLPFAVANPDDFAEVAWASTLTLPVGFAVVAVAAWIAIDPSEAELMANLAVAGAADDASAE